MNFWRKFMSFLLDCSKDGLSINCAHMQSWQKFAALILLLVLPLQGMAAVLMPFDCPPAAAYNVRSGSIAHHHEAAAENSHHQHAHASSGHEQSGEGGIADQDINGHLLCHLFSALLATITTVSAAQPPALVASIFIPIALFVPEQPQRPPRS